jgi:tetratricopeptide (TPR) repeat protein
VEVAPPGLLARARNRPATVALGIVTAVWVVEFASVYPHTLTFFNRSVGGPHNGMNYLADSNLDWGQDLKLLKAWMDDQGVAHINLAYFGSADPAYYGIDCTYLPGAPLFAEHDIRKPELPGYVAVSATVLSGVYLPERWRLHYGPLLAQEPMATIGNSIFVYWVDRWPEVTQFAAGSTGRRDIDVLRRLADSLLQQQWYTRAALYYRRYLERRPGNAVALGNLGISLMATGRKDEALTAFRRAADLDPTDLRVRGNLVIALLETGHTGEAVAQARQAVALAPQDPRARELLGRALSARPIPAPAESGGDGEHRTKDDRERPPASEATLLC